MRPTVSDAPFNPLVALQTLLSADAVKLRVKAAQQLEEYFRLLSPTPGLLLSYEPYLPLLTEVMVAPVQGGQELQTTVLAMLQTLSAHNTTGFSDWIARNAQLGNEPWLVQWSYALLLQLEKTVPRAGDGDDERWDEASPEFQQLDTVFARVMHMWRTLLDHTGDVALVDQLVKYLHALLGMQQTEAGPWRALMLKKLQTHFVDVADVLIGWMMDTGPFSPLREEILTLLHHFGRLWADNSVFSLQLLNSFADEIVNLCDSWDDHQEGDDDRLSSLVACFMMVAQCVPELALSEDEGSESHFVRVLRRVVSCPQPEYSLFCVAKCSEYLVSMSNSRHDSFTPLSVASVRFLLYHCAIQSRTHDSEVGKLSTVMENACKLASANFSSIGDSQLVRAAAIGVLEDDIPPRIVKKGGHQKRVKIMECLFHLSCANAVSYSTQLCLQLVRLGGIGAFKILVMQALQHLNSRAGENGNSYFVFEATCFILASRNPERLTFAHDEDTMHTIAILELFTAKLEKQHYRYHQHKMTPRHMYLVMKMVYAFIGAVSQWVVDRSDVVEAVNGVALRMLECAIGMVPTQAAVVQDHRLSTETLKVIDAALSQTIVVPLIPLELCRCLLKGVARGTQCSSAKVREVCIQVLETFHSRAEARHFAGDLFEVVLDLLLDPSCAVQGRIMSGGLSSVARSALVDQEKLHTPRHISQSLHPSFVGADFENILSLLLARERDESEWNTVCRSIVDRTAPDVAFSNSGILLGAIRQAAAWCVQNRLRTHFGGPAQSFASIERLLQEYSDEAHYLTGWSSRTDETTGASLSPTGKLSYQLSNWLMLEFVGELEMRMTRAIYTTDVDQSNPESEEYKTVLFFRTNKVVCDDWLNRIRPFLVEMSKNGSSYELCRYHSHIMMTTCYSKLSRVMASFATRGASEKASNELRQTEKDLDVALYAVCRCHCDAKDADSVIGLQRWGESVSSALGRWYQLNKGHLDIDEEQCKMPLFKWLNAVRYETEMRYEDAAAEYASLLQPVLTQSKSQGLSAAKIFESPMTYLRISPPTLLGCIKQCAKCYVALREWTKLRQFATQFIELTQSLVDYCQPIEGVQAIFNCSDMWSNEIGTICSLETEGNGSTEETANKDELKGEHTKRAALALRLWNAVSEADPRQTSAGSFPNNRAGQLRHDLIPLALQPSPWNGYAGEKVGKRAEETFLRVCGISKKSQLPAGFHQTKMLQDILKLNPETYDSVTWGQPFCTPSSGCSSWDGQNRSSDAACLHLTGVARLARKQHNFGFARSLLREAASITGASRVPFMTLSYEKAKFLETIGMEDEGRHLLETHCETSLGSIGSNLRFVGQESVTVRSLLHLATSYTKAGNIELLSPVTSRFLETLNDVSAVVVSSDLQDVSAYRCLKAAITVLPKSAKAWVRYSHWCYDRAQREIDRVAGQNGYIHLDPADESEMNSLLDEIGISEPDRDAIIRVFCHFLDNGELISQQSDVFRQLCTDRAPPDHNADAVDRLTWLQQACHSKVLRFHTLSARGYGKYLTVLLSDSDSSVPRRNMTMIALRLLGLLTTYGTEGDVVSALEDVFSSGPVAPWSYVVPQLIARVHHPVAAVSYLVCMILKRLAHHSPHAIVYPAVADSMEPQASFSNLQEERGAASNTFATVLQELQNVSSGQVEGVRLLISELRRVSILWDEAWISTLVKLSADVSRRTSTLEKEATRVEKNVSLSAKEKSELAQRKLVAIMKPIYVSIERLWKETCGSVREQHAVTPHERKFLKEYGELIEKAMENFRICCNAELRASSSPMTSPQELWQPFADVLKALMKATGRREQLPLHDISPAMASTSRQLALTNMPGAFFGKSAGQVEPITIHRVASSVAVLRTKTKPKSLELIGSDGKTYKYLLKAREDLRLDERIMQFLRVTNEFLRADGAAAARDLSAQSYSVIPLSRNAGLIQMVPDVVPLFQVYTARNDASGRAQQDPVAGSSAQQQPPPPPTAQFYAKLKQHGIANVAPNHRSQWPASVLKHVYQELVSQRPRNVLQQEILLRSDDLRESWTKSVRLSKSLAVMSVLGYIVGLGDRHLDNILLCVNSGDIVHIDHNVCFDKGHRLKVPEVVPFRLTPMLQDALGFTGVEGKFRVAFETTLRVVRSDNVREALLTLFEAFVYSPLVDWIAEDRRKGRSGDLKARLEVNVNLSLFLSRAEERRQDTISFGRQYEQYADVISRTLRTAEVPFVGLLEQRKQLLSLDSEEQTLLKEASSVEADLCIYQSSEKAKHAEFETATSQAKEITARMTSFANECLARHQQIEVWREKSINFAETDPEAQLSAVIHAIGTASFQKVHATLCNTLERARIAGQQRELLAALESKCRSVDTDVVRLRLEIERLAGCLIPYLSYYSHHRKELDAYLDLELKLTGKDVYFKWWNLCTEGLRGLAGEQNGESTDIIVTSDAPSDESIAESTIMLRRLSEVHLDTKPYPSELEKTLRFSKAGKVIQDVGNTLSVMKLSNAQGQRLMKLAGASWIIETMEQLDAEECASNVHAGTLGVFTPLLTMPSKLQAVAAVSHSCSALLDLVSTPKGSMKRLRASELLVPVRDRDQQEAAGKGLNGFNDILQEVGLLAVVLQEELISNLHGRQVGESGKVLELIKEIVATPDGTQELMSVVSIPSTTPASDVKSSVHTIQMLREHPAVHNVLAATFAVTQKVASQVDTLCETHVMTEEVERIKRSSSASWIAFVLDFIELSTETEGGQANHAMEENASTLWSAQMDAFLSNSLVKLLRNQLANIISSEWKFDFLALAHDQDTPSDDDEPRSLTKRWTEFCSSQIPDILPSTVISEPNAEAQTRDVSKSVAELMTVCEEWCGHQWSAAQSNLWAHRVSSLRIRHERHLRYASWLATKPAEVGESVSPSRVQLLAFMSSQVPQLNALLTDQVAVEASVLELAQQMDYITSTLGDVSTDQPSVNESLHACVQSCYGKVTGLFDYGRTLADLVQGISVIETSSGESTSETGNMELEVDIVGKSFLQSASTASLEMQLSSEALTDVAVRVQELQGELNSKRDIHDALASRKRAAEDEFHSKCLEKKDTVLEIACVLSRNVKELRCLLKGFDKLKTPSKQHQAPTSTMDLRRQQLQAEQSDSLSPDRPAPNAVVEFSFMENDRLVSILLRSIRSVNHLEQLEGVLEKHGEVCASLRGAVAQLDQVLRAFDARGDQLLAGNGQDNRTAQESSRAYLLLQLLLDLIETLRVDKSVSPLLGYHGESRTDTPEDMSTSLLVVGRDLVRGCVKLFFEATEMADRLSSAGDENRRSSGVTSLPDDVGEEEEQYVVAEDSAAPLAMESGNSAVMGVDSDSGSSSHDTAASTPRSVEEKSQYGLQVLKRIEEKLCGTVKERADVSAVLTVEQQASWLIDEATKTDNLCVMYEGWTPWI
ncbi:hypothetical protein PHYPSEUDO_002327 [Phytophthora pseudosyringae]|uniref:non-specific serine/threonine protein kinase n=1 Tax=Phytophthora pseudosyringae TaxID=221518 RepID=A0A8T1WJL2_9STRA|nr:hypothetical protein PHYPSEUDO_002327 [Phytophthora pseudosyringae]